MDSVPLPGKNLSLSSQPGNSRSHFELNRSNNRQQALALERGNSQKDNKTSGEKKPQGRDGS